MIYEMGGFIGEVQLCLTDGWVAEDVYHSKFLDLVVEVTYELQTPQPS